MTYEPYDEQDLQHLRLLSIFHYVVGGIMGLVGCFPIIHLVVGIALVTGSFGDDRNRPPEFMGYLFIIPAALMIVCAWSMAIAMFVAGAKLGRHRSYTFCLVVAAVECIFMPIGTTLGVFTIIVLNRPSVKEMFAATRH